MKLDSKDSVDKVKYLLEVFYIDCMLEEKHLEYIAFNRKIIRIDVPCSFLMFSVRPLQSLKSLPCPQAPPEPSSSEGAFPGLGR